MHNYIIQLVLVAAAQVSEINATRTNRDRYNLYNHSPREYFADRLMTAVLGIFSRELIFMKRPPGMSVREISLDRDARLPRPRCPRASSTGITITGMILITAVTAERAKKTRSITPRRATEHYHKFECPRSFRTPFLFRGLFTILRPPYSSPSSLPRCHPRE